jgi:hypothetical protein
LRGTIDACAATLSVLWMRPRILSRTAVQILARRVGEWESRVESGTCARGSLPRAEWCRFQPMERSGERDMLVLGKIEEKKKKKKKKRKKKKKKEKSPRRSSKKKSP